VEDVAKNYKVKGLVSKLIDYSVKDHSNDDLCQYIFEQLLIMDNKKLNSMYQDGINTSNPNKQSTKLRNFISQMIKMQRNGGKGQGTDYKKYFHIKDTNETFYDHIDIPDSQEEYDHTIDMIVDYINIKSDMGEEYYYSSSELKLILAFTLLKKYYNSDFTLKKLASHLGLSVSTVNKLIRLAKDDILVHYKKIKDKI
jgi:hypothetical protein